MASGNGAPSVQRQYSSEIPSKTYKVELAYKNEFYRNMFEQYKSGNFTDMNVIVGQERFACHKIVLASSLPYFRGLLAFKIVEGDKGEVELPDVSAAAFKSVLEFIYSASITLSGENVQDILELANFLNCEALCTMCSQYIIDGLSSMNCMPVIQMADSLGQELLRKHAVCFALEHFAETVDTESFMLAPLPVIEELIKSENIVYKSSGECSPPQVQEMGILKSILAYVNFAKSERLGQLKQLLTFVRMSWVDQSQLKEMLRLSPLKDSPESVNLLKSAMNLPRVHITNRDAIVWQRPRQQEAAQSVSWSAALADGGHIRALLHKFDDSEICSDPLVHVTGMKMFIRRWDGRPVIGGLNVFYSNGEVTKHGGDNFGYEVTEFLIAPGDVIKHIDAQSGWLIDSIAFTTLHNKVFGPYGGSGGGARISSPPDLPSNQGYLACIRGQVVQTQGSEAITHLQFQWRYMDYRKLHGRTSLWSDSNESVEQNYEELDMSDSDQEY